MNGANEIDAFINSKQAMRVTLMIYLSCITYVYSKNNWAVVSHLPLHAGLP
jgi:hypothetical protein